LISNECLEEGERFSKDISTIIQIIEGVEKQMSQHKLKSAFAESHSQNVTQRKIQMSRTIQANDFHQTIYSKKQHA
jgi:hypothetical protein